MACAAAVLLVAILTPLRADAEEIVNAWPLFHYERDDDHDASRIEVLWPFFDLTRGGKHDAEEVDGVDREWSSRIASWGVRPLFNIFTVRPQVDEDIEPDEFLKSQRITQLEAIWPIMLREWRGEESIKRTFPVYFETKRKVDGGFEKDTAYFPLLFWGSSPREGWYFMFFPVGGTLKDKLGKDKITVALFPLFVTTRFRDFRAWHFPWPLLSWGKGDHRTEFRFWPLYGRRTTDGEFEGGYVLWPFINYSRREDRDDGSKNWFFFPFYGRHETATTLYTTYLWPFFTHRVNKRSGDTVRTAPGPFVRVERSDELRRTDVWPFYGVSDGKGGLYTRRYVVWPFYRKSRKIRKDGDIEREFATWPFYTDRRREYQEDATSRRQIFLWPLSRYRRDRQENTDFKTLSLLWFNDPDGFERHYSVFWRLFEHSKRSGGMKSTRFIWRLVRYDRSPEESRFWIGPLFKTTRGREGGRSFSLMGGLLGAGNEPGRARFKLLYVPLWRGSSEE